MDAAGRTWSGRPAGRAARGLVLAATLWGAGPGGAPEAGAQPAVDLVPILSGLSQPVYVTHAGDGSGRLFVVERAGRIRVRAPGAAEAPVFLDISDRVALDGERGLLGLAFHPAHVQNRRFFVHYTRQPDGAVVIAEFRASAADPDVADPQERVLLTVPHPRSNHNGGMVAFGPDGFLHIALGDGGGANDPDNRAQDPADLLGKLLRIDVDRSEGGLPYASPPGNPLVGTGLGRPEILALGFRNPYRFSFDRLSGALLVADVGQDQREEVSLVVPGGNYGWRVIEGHRCTGLGPGPCPRPDFVPPLLEYNHGGGRCAIIGGYVYRGTAGTLAGGTYTAGDFCSGEIFAFDGDRLTVLVDSPHRLTSFGEDEAGEIHVVAGAGQVFRLATPATAGPRITLSVNDLLIQPGDPLRLSARLENPGEATTADVYLGALLPDGVSAVLVTGLAPLTTTAVRLDGDPAGLLPLAPALPLEAGLDRLLPDALAFPFTGSELPVGRTTLFLALGRAGSRVELLSLHLLGIDVEP